MSKYRMVHGTRIKELDRDSNEYWRKAGQVAISFVGNITPCKKCTHPIIEGYICPTCGDSNPSETFEEEKNESS